MSYLFVLQPGEVNTSQSFRKIYFGTLYLQSNGILAMKEFLINYR